MFRAKAKPARGRLRAASKKPHVSPAQIAGRDMSDKAETFM